MSYYDNDVKTYPKDKSFTSTHKRKSELREILERPSMIPPRTQNHNELFRQKDGSVKGHLNGVECHIYDVVADADGNILSEGREGCVPGMSYTFAKFFNK